MQLPQFLTQDPDGFIRLADHRIGLHHLIRLYRDGYSPEMLCEHFPTLSLALIHKTIAFYLEAQEWVDQYLTEHDAAMGELAAAAAAGPSLADLRHRLKAKQRAHAS